MDNQEQHMDKDFQQAFEDFNLDIQPQVWEEIREELHPRKEKKKTLWLWTSGIAAVLVIGLLLIPNSNEEFNQVLVDELEKDFNEDLKEEVNNSKDSIIPNKKTTKPIIKPKALIAEQIIILSDDITEEQQAAIIEFEQEAKEQLPVIADFEQQVIDQVLDVHPITILAANDVVQIIDSNTTFIEDSTTNQVALQDSIVAPKKKKPSLTVPLDIDFGKKRSKWLLAANLNSSTSNGGSDQLSDDQSVMATDASDEAATSDFTEEFSDVNKAASNITKSGKLVTAMSVGYKVQHNLYVNAGLAYTNQSFFVDGQSSLVSGIGVPVGLRFNLLDKNKKHIYISGGLMYELLLNAPLDINQSWNISSAIGGDLPVWNQWQAFIQIGALKEIITIVESPLSPLFQIGLRYQFEK